MNIQFKDVAHLYFGCKIKSATMGVIHDWNTFTDKTLSYFEDGSFLPTLRPLISMTYDEAIGFFKVVETEVDEVILPNQNNGGDLVYIFKNQMYKASLELFSPPALTYLLSKRFDLFGLIESGQAVDATTLSPNPYTNA